jgi:hypothetical protein
MSSDRHKEANVDDKGRRLSPQHLSAATTSALALKRLWIFARALFGRQSPRFAKYQPALRLGTRRVEERLLGRIARAALETSC